MIPSSSWIILVGIDEFEYEFDNNDSNDDDSAVVGVVVIVMIEDSIVF